MHAKHTMMRRRGSAYDALTSTNLLPIFLPMRSSTVSPVHGGIQRSGISAQTRLPGADNTALTHRHGHRMPCEGARRHRGSAALPTPALGTAWHVGWTAGCTGREWARLGWGGAWCSLVDRSRVQASWRAKAGAHTHKTRRNKPSVLPAVQQTRAGHQTRKQSLSNRTKARRCCAFPQPGSLLMVFAAP